NATGVSVTGTAGTATVTVSADITNAPISVQNNTGGTITFSGGTKSISTAAVAAVTLATNTGSTINFTNGGLQLTTTTASAFSATGGGAISVQSGAITHTLSTTR